MEYESDSDTNCNWGTWNNSQRIGKGIERFGNKRTNGNHPDYSIIKNTKKSPEVLRRLAVTQTPMKHHQLTLVGKHLKK